MKRSLVLLLSLGLFLNLTACGGEKNKSEKAALPPKEIYIAEGDKSTASSFSKTQQQRERFNNALAREYKFIAKNAEEQKDYTNASYFRRKSLNSRTFFNVAAPGKPDSTLVKDEATLNKLYDARSDLTQKLGRKDLLIAVPVSSAKAIANYDCWVAQAQTSGAIPDMKCRDSYNWAITKINDAEKQIERINREYELAKNPPKVDEKPKLAAATTTTTTKTTITDKKPSDKATKETDAKTTAKDKTIKTVTTTTTTKTGKAGALVAGTVGPEPAPNLLVDESDGSQPDLAYVIYFDKGADSVKTTSQAELDRAAADIKTNQPSRISVNGHTDKTIDDNTSMVLSKTRADNVRNLLIQKGVNKDNIRSFGFGKSDNSFADEASQNRVEIIFKQKKAQ